jgi:hypothetical protein
LVAAVAASAAFMVAGAAEATSSTYNFYNITGNSPVDAAAGEMQLSVTISDYGPGQVLFTFHNSGPSAMSITDVYFDDGSLLALADLIDADQNGGDAGVDFTQDASPADLPGGGQKFNTTAGFSADSDSPMTQQSGVNPGETLGVIFDLQAGLNYSDVISALALGYEEGGLVIGIHVQGFDGGGSESFTTMIPLPTPALLGLAGLAPVAIRRRR